LGELINEEAMEIRRNMLSMRQLNGQLNGKSNQEKENDKKKAHKIITNSKLDLFEQICKYE
jgi:hypothetical protein